MRKEVIPKEAERKASWFTGFLTLPRGKMTRYVHMGYASSLEQYRLLVVREGHALANQIFTAEDYSKYKQPRFEAFTKTERYRTMKKELEPVMHFARRCFIGRAGSPNPPRTLNDVLGALGERALPAESRFEVHDRL